MFLQAQADILQRFTALTAVSEHLFEFAVELGLQFLPDGTGEKSHKLREFKEKQQELDQFLKDNPDIKPE